jgi:NIMA (never in mitosis gene a)-related kinase
MKFRVNLGRDPSASCTKLNANVIILSYCSNSIADQKTYVLKQIDTSKMSSQMRKEAVHEATILSKINSPYIVKYYDSFTEKSNINIIMEYCENGDLGLYLKRQMGKSLPE